MSKQTLLYMKNPVPGPVQVKADKTWMVRLLNQWQLQLMVIPPILFIIVFHYFPIWGLLNAFKEYDIINGFFASPWVGFKQFRLFFESPDFVLVMKNTVVISLMRLVLVFPAPILLALLLNEVNNMHFKRTIQTLTYLPHFISWVVISGFVFSMLSTDNGSINLLLMKLNLIHEPVKWLSMPEYFKAILISTNIWKEVGYNSIIYLAAISGIDPQLYEAASMDGAKRFKQMYLVTLPCILPVIIVYFILQLGRILNAGFEDILVLTNNGNNAILHDASMVLDVYVYEKGVSMMRYSYGTAVGLFTSLVNILFLVGANTLVRRGGNEGLW